GIVLRSSNGFSAPLGPAQPNEPGVSFNLIGGTVAGAGNLVEFNGSSGIAIFGNPVSASGQPNIGNAIEGNSIFLNGRNFMTASSAPLPLLGIDLTNGFTFPRDDGVTANDSKGHGAANDPNNFQNFPVIDSATSNSTTTSVTGTLTGPANSTFRIEFFASDTDPLGLPAEGEQFLGFVDATTDAGGNASFSASLNVPVGIGRAVTATASDGIGNTSEFSAAVFTTPSPPPPPSLSINDVSLTEGNSGTKKFTFTVTRSGDLSGVSNVFWSTADGTATAPSDYTAVGMTLLHFAAHQAS